MPKSVLVASRIALLVALALSASPHPNAFAQTIPPLPLDCGPGRVNVGDLVTLNVGNPSASSTNVQLRLFDHEGVVLAQQSFLLAPGRSRSMRWTTAGPGTAQALVRGEILVAAGPAQPRVRGTLQIFNDDLSYGEHFLCSGDFGGRGPV